MNITYLKLDETIFFPEIYTQHQNYKNYETRCFDSNNFEIYKNFRS